MRYNLRVLLLGCLAMLSQPGPHLQAACSGDQVLSVPSESALRSAIEAGGTICLTFTGAITFTNTIEITKNVTLDGSDGQVVLDGGNTVRLFRVTPGVSLELRRLTLANGLHAVEAENAQGGAIFNEGGNLRLISCLLTNNHARAQLRVDAAGGAIYSTNGNVLLDRTICIDNAATGGGWANPSAFAGTGWGGVLYAHGGTVTIMESTFLSNRCSAHVQAAYEGKAGAQGGAVYLAEVNAVLTNSVFDGNQLGLWGRDAWNSAQTGPAPAGGGLYIQSGTTLVHRVTFRKNQALESEAKGGAVYNNGTLLAQDSHFAGNESRAVGAKSVGRSGKGGALYNNASAALTGCTFDSNLAKGSDGRHYMIYLAQSEHGYGGAIYNAQSLALTNCTIFGNQALGGSVIEGAIPPGSAFGGGLCNFDGSATLQNVTVSSNFVLSGNAQTSGRANLGANVFTTNGTFSARNTILAYGGAPGNFSGTLTDAGWNLSSDATCNFTNATSLNSTDPKLGPLTTNGGPTLTIALLTGSPAIDAGGAEGAPQVDQRGVSRPAGAGFDIGAFEYTPSQSPGTRLAISSQAGQLLLQYSVPAGIAYRFETSTNLLNWDPESIVGPFPSIVNWSRQLVPAGERRFFRLVPESTGGPGPIEPF